MPYTVKLTYFKQTGKYYSDGEYTSSKQHLFEIWDEVHTMNVAGKLPGLCDGSKGWIIHVRAPDHPHDHPRLVLPEGVADDDR